MDDETWTIVLRHPLSGRPAETTWKVFNGCIDARVDDERLPAELVLRGRILEHHTEFLDAADPPKPEEW